MRNKSALFLTGLALSLGAVVLVACLSVMRTNVVPAPAGPASDASGAAWLAGWGLRGGEIASAPGDALLQTYLRTKTLGVPTRAMLDELYALGFSKTRAHFEALRASLKTARSSEERVGLARVIGSFYSREDANGLNIVVREVLREARASDDLNYLAASVLAYTRLDYFEDSERFLADAWERRALDDDGYYGELAHLLNLAPPAGRATILQKLLEGNNAYANAIIASQLKDATLADLPADEVRVLEKLLAEREPVLPGSRYEIGTLSTFQYSDWLKSIAVLRAAGSPAKYDQIILENIAAADGDPRKAIAFLSNSESDSFILSQRGTPAYAQLLARLDAHARDPASSGTIRDLVRMIHHRTDVLSK